MIDGVFPPFISLCHLNWCNSYFAKHLKDERLNWYSQLSKLLLTLHSLDQYRLCRIDEIEDSMSKPFLAIMVIIAIT